MSDNIQEAEVGSGTKISDTKQSEKRAQITLKAIQLRLKQEKERAALQQQKKSLQVKEEIEESFSPSQIAALKAEYSKINGIDPASDTYKKLISMLDRLDLKSLQSLAGAEIKFVSKLAQNRVMKKSMKKEAVDPYSLPNFKDLKSAIKHASDKVKTHRDQSDGIEIYKSRGGYDINHTSNSSGRDTTKKSGGKLLGIVYRNQKNDGAIYKNQYHNVIDSIKEEVQLDELSTNKLADYKKKAGENASAADKAGDTKTGNKRFSGIMKATRKQFDNDAKKTNEDVTEASQRVDSLVTDALKIMKGSELKDAVQALKTVLGDREYNDRRGHYNFYVKQLVDMYGKKANEELDIELDEVLSKDSTAGDFIHDFVNSDNPKFAGKSKEKRKQMALAAYYAKQKNEELSPKQKAMDKNKNGKIDGSDLAKLRGEELSAKQKVLDKNNNGKIDGDDLAKLRKKPIPESDAAYGAWLKAKEEKRKMNNISSADKSKLSAVVAMLNKEKKKQPQGADFATQRRKERMASNGRMDEAKSDYEVYHKDYSTAVQTAIKQAEKRGYEVDMDDWHDKVATGPKKPSSGKTNSFSINLMKDGKPAKKKLQMQVYNMDNHKYELNMYIEEIQLEEMTDGDKSSIALQAMVARKKLQQTAGKNKSQSFIDKMVSKANAGDRLPKKPADEYDRKVVKYLKKKHGMSEASVAETYEGVVDKIKAIKRGMQAKAKADDHFDKAGDPKNANASKDLKKAVRYHNLLNKEEVVLEAKKSKTFKNIKKKMKEEETPNKSTVKKGDMLTGKREPIEINPELKEPAR